MEDGFISIFEAVNYTALLPEASFLWHVGPSTHHGRLPGIEESSLGNDQEV